MTNPKIDLKTPWVAGLLAYLIPGAGHLYQRRFFKAGLYFVCIFGTFLYGMHLGEWKTVYWTENPGRYKFGQPGKRNYGYLTQLGIGIPSLYAYIQSRRYHTAKNRPVVLNMVVDDQGAAIRNPLDSPLTAKFKGTIVSEVLEPEFVKNEVTGEIHLEPHNRMFRGTFTGTITSENGKSQEIKRELGHSLYLDSPVLGHERRQLEVGILAEDGKPVGELVGYIPRSFGNWFEAPLDDAILQDLNGRLTKRFEMALVFTWIAGLLNILAIWDAAQGPAYGYDDEQRKQEKQANKKTASNDQSSRKAESTEEMANIAKQDDDSSSNSDTDTSTQDKVPAETTAKTEGD
ncbi:MAG: hypothetical protein Tsb009_24880 [Planctomycetaceae bacterium]